jgi:exodeoxyribonuclease-3
MKIATWNINSVRRRTASLVAWLQRAKPDVLLLQEIKCQDEQFPRLEIEAAGYRCAVVGQKGFNGVALVSRAQPEIVNRALPGDEGDVQARYVEARFATAAGPVRVASIYLPNGNPVDSDKFAYKLGFMDRLRRRARELLDSEEIVVLGGDYNVCPTDMDVYDPAGWANDALCRPESRKGLRAILNLGYTDAFRALHPDAHAYSFWDYQGGAWTRDNGLRIDHLLLSPQATDRLKACDIDKSERGRAEPSDHVPVWIELAAEGGPPPS